MSTPGQSFRGLRARTASVLPLLALAFWSLGGAGASAAAVTGPTGDAEATVWLERAEGFAQSGGNAMAYRMLVDRAKGWLREGRVPGAVALLDAATGYQPESPEGWALIGRAHARNRDYGAAQDALSAAVDLGDTSAGTLVFLGAVLWENGDLAAAEATYKRSLEAGGGGGLARAQLGRLMLWQGRYAEAADTLGLALAVVAPSPDVLFDHAEALRGAGRVEEAIEAYRRVNRVAPEMLRGYYGLAVMLARAGQTQESAAAFARYEELYREDQEWTRVEERNKGEIERARAWIEEGRIDAALAHLGTLEQSADVLVLSAQAHSRAGRKAQALSMLERAVSLDPGRQDLRRMLGEMRMTSSGDGG